MDSHIQQPSRTEVWKMFNRVAPRYDLLNRILSLGIDRLWRRKMTSFLPPREKQHVLDLATGTADQLLSLFENRNEIKSATGMDLADRMLHIGRKKVERAGLSDVITLKIGSATDIAANDQEFDAVTISFGIRNVADTTQSLREIYRVLKPGGRLLVLEFSLPKSPLFCNIYLFYLRHILPKVGAFLSKDPYAYRYLNETIETFPCGEAFRRILKLAGFTAIAVHPLTFGIATIYQGDRPE
ncbi:MAG: bifunctional demethylmenaquinone methyltransferase/2-methoxy-6-polyprenyl-1,4-benzoquinol methylase UbiE [Deltaproteobacteria bacterium]|nr:bifunctional demethylmenaquinone methyltransferase/2-methoxy-6-polyprenyl-1,4-benzoquinol methylase UbiE [Deltaproteobacteria bacterium]OEU45456.1 MAG: bifunctional demethylmenaquinone methyltransferase/2-methoxy-6-polyprenyl-1,4-benzoquinol methylase [Desulfobacterales bacterium S7086C20]